MKPDKITGGACACNDDKVIFENPLNWTTRSFIFAKQREYENGPATPEPSGETIVRGRDRGKSKEAELYAPDPVTGKANFSPGITSGLPVPAMRKAVSHRWRSQVRRCINCSVTR